MILYDLAGADRSVRFSPHCWKSRFALAHKGLPVTTQPWLFTQKDDIAFSGQGFVPILVDGERTVSDSWAIAIYLDEAYPDRPRLFADETARGLGRFVNSWVDTAVLPAIARLILRDIYDVIDEADRAYFRQSREQRFGVTLEEFVAARPQQLAAFRAVLAPVRRTLETQPFLTGAAAGYGDYALAGAFMWARCASDIVLLDEGDPVATWFETMLDLFDGLGRKAPRPRFDRAA